MVVDRFAHSYKFIRERNGEVNTDWWMESSPSDHAFACQSVTSPSILSLTGTYLSRNLLPQFMDGHFFLSLISCWPIHNCEATNPWSGSYNQRLTTVKSQSDRMNAPLVNFQDKFLFFSIFPSPRLSVAHRVAASIDGLGQEKEKRMEGESAGYRR